MLNKMIKHEFKEMAKPLIPLNLILIALSLLGSLFMATGLSDALSGLFVVIMLLFVLSVVALFVVTAVYLTIRFYKTMFSAQGYLTHTLPLSSSSILNSKILSSMVWLILTFFVCVFSVLALVFSETGMPSAADFHSFQQEISMVFGIGFTPFLIAVFCMIVVMCLYYLLMVFASLSIGQLFNQNRIPAAIGAGVVFYMAQQIISLVSLLILGLGVFEKRNLDQVTAAMASGFYQKIWLLAVGETLLFTIAFFIICHVIVKKKLNLE